MELQAFDAEGQLLFESGVVDKGEPVVRTDDQDPQRWVIRDRALNQAGEETHFFWDIVSVERSTLPPPTLLNPTDPAYEDPHVLHPYRFGSDTPVVAVHVRVLMRPLAIELLQSLVDSGDLDPDLIDRIPTFELESAALNWNAEDAIPRPSPSGRPMLCTP